MTRLLLHSLAYAAMSLPFPNATLPTVQNFGQNFGQLHCSDLAVQELTRLRFAADRHMGSDCVMGDRDSASQLRIRPLAFYATH